MLYSGGKSAGGVCLFFGPDGGVWLEFFVVVVVGDGLMVLWRSEDVRLFEGGILLCVLTAAATGRRC